MHREFGGVYIEDGQSFVKNFFFGLTKDSGFSFEEFANFEAIYNFQKSQNFVLKIEKNFRGLTLIIINRAKMN